MTNIEKILKVDVNVEITLNSNFIEKVKFEKEELINDPKYSNGIYYTWSAYSKFNNWKAIFPLLSHGMNGYVKFFKTLIGAKRNFIRKYLKENNK